MADNPLLMPGAAVAQRRNPLLDVWDAGKAALAEAWHGPQSPITGGPMFDPNAPAPAQSAGDVVRRVRDEYLNPATRGVGVNTVLGFTEGPAAIKAYHGSPHSFDKFDMSKLGTGEGAQVFGHGLYFAGSEDVARSYQRNLAPGLVDGAGKHVPVTPDALSAYEMLRLHGGDYDAAIAAVKGYRRATTHAGTRQDFDNTLDQFDVWRGSGVRPSGHMYEVALQTEPNRLLDWDSGLKYQSPEVRQGLRAARDTGAEFRWPETATPGMRADPSGPTGQVLYQALAGSAGPAEASAVLRAAGIDGIQYLDGGSRVAGTGSRNYVMFDDATIQLLRKYGLLPLTAGGAASAVTGGGAEQ